jgi:hypothetical protein
VRHVAGSLGDLPEAEAPDGDWGLVIADNDSTNSTSEAFQAFTQRLPLTYVFERLRRNRTLPQLAHGDLHDLTSVRGGLIHPMLRRDGDVIFRQRWTLQLLIGQ